MFHLKDDFPRSLVLITKGQLISKRLIERKESKTCRIQSKWADIRSFDFRVYLYDTVFRNSQNIFSSYIFSYTLQHLFNMANISLSTVIVKMKFI